MAQKMRELGREFDQQILPLVTWHDGNPSFRISLDSPEPGTTLVLLVEKGPALERIEDMKSRTETPDLSEAGTLEG